MKIYQPTSWEKFSLWVELDDVQLTVELITYYLVCCLFGAITGFAIGNRLMYVMSMLVHGG